MRRFSANNRELVNLNDRMPFFSAASLYWLTVEGKQHKNLQNQLNKLKSPTADQWNEVKKANKNEQKTTESK